MIVPFHPWKHFLSRSCFCFEMTFFNLFHSSDFENVESHLAKLVLKLFWISFFPIVLPAHALDSFIIFFLPNSFYLLRLNVKFCSCFCFFFIIWTWRPFYGLNNFRKIADVLNLIISIGTWIEKCVYVMDLCSGFSSPIRVFFGIYWITFPIIRTHTFNSTQCECVCV